MRLPVTMRVDLGAVDLPEQCGLGWSGLVACTGLDREPRKAVKTWARRRGWCDDLHDVLCVVPYGVVAGTREGANRATRYNITR